MMLVMVFGIIICVNILRAYPLVYWFLVGLFCYRYVPIKLK